MAVRLIEYIMNDIINKKKSSDIIEIFIKVKLNIKLSDQELFVYSRLDDVEKDLISDFIKSPSFCKDVERIMDKILGAENLINGNKICFEDSTTTLTNITR